MNDFFSCVNNFEIVSLNVSQKTGTRKTPVKSLLLVEGIGAEGDAHAGLLPDRQLSLLAIEEIEFASKNAQSNKCNLIPDGINIGPGDFAENVTTRGVALHELPLGTKIKLGTAILEVSKIGKECHTGCEIRNLIGDCIMPKKGIFAKVIKTGEVNIEDCGYYNI